MKVWTQVKPKMLFEDRVRILSTNLNLPGKSPRRKTLRIALIFSENRVLLATAVLLQYTCKQY